MADSTSIRPAFRWRAMITLVVGTSFAIMAFTGVILYLVPQGWVAKWGNWTMLGLRKEQWGSLHMNASAIFLVIASLHLYLNWRAMLNYFRRKAAEGLRLRWEPPVVVAMMGIMVAGTIRSWPGFGKLAEWNHNVKNYWAKSSGSGPVAHTEELTLAALAEQLKVPPADVVEALRKEGYEVSAEQRLADVAAAKGVTPKDVYAAIGKHIAAAKTLENAWAGQGHGRGGGGGAGAGGGGAGGGGFGRGGGGAGGGGGGMGRQMAQLSVEDFAAKVKLSATEVAEALRADGFVVENLKVTIEEVAKGKSMTARDVYQALSKRFPGASLPGSGGGPGGGGGGPGRRGGGGGGERP